MPECVSRNGAEHLCAAPTTLRHLQLCGGRLRVPVVLALVAEINFFGLHKGGSIRDGVILGVSSRQSADSAASWAFVLRL